MGESNQAWVGLRLTLKVPYDCRKWPTPAAGRRLAPQAHVRLAAECVSQAGRWAGGCHLLGSHSLEYWYTVMLRSVVLMSDLRMLVMTLATLQVRSTGSDEKMLRRVDCRRLAVPASQASR